MPPRFLYDSVSAMALQQALQGMGMSGTRFADLTGSQPEMIRDCLSGEKPVSPWISLVLRLFSNTENAIVIADEWQSGRIEGETISGFEFQDRLNGLDMPANAFARITGAQDRTIARWIRDQRAIPSWPVLVLTLFEKVPGAIPEARQWAAEMIRQDAMRPGIEYPYLEDSND